MGLAVLLVTLELAFGVSIFILMGIGMEPAEAQWLFTGMWLVGGAIFILVSRGLIFK